MKHLTQLEEKVPQGTPPLLIDSSTLVTNLNADLLDSKHASDFATADHGHSTYDRATSTLSGTSVFSDIVVTDGIVTSISTRAITKSDITTLGIPAQDTVYTHPTTHPYSMITGAPTSLPASGGHALSATHLLGDDTRAVNSAPSVYMNGGARYVSRAGWQTEFKTRTAINSPPLSGTYVYLQTHTPWSDPSGGYPIQVVYGNGTPCWRVGVSTSAWSAWQRVNDGGNADTVNGKTVGTNVPANAKFTDTVYTHPSTHSISEISGLQAALDSKVDTPVQIIRW